MSEQVTVRNITSYRNLDFVDGTSIAPGDLATIDLDFDDGASETTGDRTFNAIRHELSFYVKNGQAAVVGADS